MWQTLLSLACAVKEDRFLLLLAKAHGKDKRIEALPKPSKTLFSAPVQPFCSPVESRLASRTLPCVGAEKVAAAGELPLKRHALERPLPKAYRTERCLSEHVRFLHHFGLHNLGT